MKLSQERAKDIVGPKFHPILFSTEMVRAILEGRKTQTRRIVKPQPELYHEEGPMLRWSAKKHFLQCELDRAADPFAGIPCPYGQIGDVLWVRESIWQVASSHRRYPESDDWDLLYRPIYHYLTDGPVEVKGKNEWGIDPGTKLTKGWIPYEYRYFWRKRPSIHMPKSACRIFLQITDTRVERLQEISEGDAIAEGVESYTFSGRMSFTAYKDYLNRQTQSQDDILNAIGSYKSLWQKINGADSWNENPWVWVISFSRIDKPSNF